MAEVEGERAAVRILNERDAAPERGSPVARCVLSKIRHKSSYFKVCHSLHLYIKVHRLLHQLNAQS